MNNVTPQQFSDFAAAFFWIIGGLTGLVFLINGIRSWFAKADKMPQPMVVAMAKEFVPIEVHKAFESEVRSGFRAVDEELKKVDKDRRESVSRCYESTRKAVGEMRDEMKSGQDALAAQLRENNDGLNSRINDILKAVSTLTGAFEQSQRK